MDAQLVPARVFRADSRRIPDVVAPRRSWRQPWGCRRKTYFCWTSATCSSFGRRYGRCHGEGAVGQVFVDGLGVGDVGNVVLRDRRQLSQDGILIAVVTIDQRTGAVVAGPDIVSRGLRVHSRVGRPAGRSEGAACRKRWRKWPTSTVTQWNVLKNKMRDAISRFLYEKTKRRPIILPVVMEV